MFDFEKQLSALGKQTVLCIGDLMLDNFVYGEVSRISPEAPAPVIAVAREDVIVGGAGNVARNIASLGAHCIFLGVIGKDADVVTKQMSGIFSLVRPKVDVISEDIALAGQQMGELLLRRIRGEKPEALQVLQVPEIPF